MTLALLGMVSIVVTVAMTTAAYFGAGATAGAGQTRRGAIIEAWFNVAIGFGINYAANFVFLPLVGVHVGAADNFWLGCIYTAVSVARTYAIRRWFNARIHAAALRLAR